MSWPAREQRQAVDLPAKRDKGLVRAEFDAALFETEFYDNGDDSQEQNLKTLAPSPHQLQAIPRALIKSDVWHGLSSGARDLFRYLLDFSNTRSFKDVWPSVEKIEAELTIEKRSRRRYESELENAGLLKIHAPGRTVRKENGDVITFKSRSFEFLLISYINADYRAYNKAKGKIIYKPVRNYAAIMKQATEIGKKINFNIESLLTIKQGMDHLLNEFSKRLQIDGSDDLGHVHVLLHSTIFPPATAESELPHVVKIWPQKKNKDVIINPNETWKSFMRKIEKEIERAEFRRISAPLFQFSEKIELAKNRRAK